VGVKFRRTPNSLNWTLTALVPADPWTIGMGNSPPARKLASLPLSATRFGSARLWKSPRVCSALTIMPMSYFWLNRKRFRKSPNVNSPLADVTSAPKSELSLVHSRF
jgi:hypothetical protein